MAVYHGKSAKIWAWDGNNDAHAAEACTDAGQVAQITDTTKRILDPNEAQTFTDDGGEQVREIDHTTGTAYFYGVGGLGTVTAAGDHVVVANLDLMGNMHNWTIDRTLDTVESTVYGITAKTFEAGTRGWTGSAEGYFLDSTWKDSFDTVTFWFIRFYIDGTHYFQGWANINGISDNCPLSELVSESLTFQGTGFLSYA